VLLKPCWGRAVQLLLVTDLGQTARSAHADGYLVIVATLLATDIANDRIKTMGREFLASDR